MLTKVYLDGAMGEKFGREWEFEINSPREALLMVDANKPGLISWLKRVSQKYTHYRVLVEYWDGKREELTDDSFVLERKMKEVRFVPIIEGSSKWISVIVGVILVIVGVIVSAFGYVPLGAALINAGVSMMAVGVITALTTKTPHKPDKQDGRESNALSSNVFSSSVTTAYQGVPVPLIYGRRLVSPHVISAGTFVS